VKLIAHFGRMVDEFNWKVILVKILFMINKAYFWDYKFRPPKIVQIVVLPFQGMHCYLLISHVDKNLVLYDFFLFFCN
jgi:hypothetical protein